eukprot:gene6939-11102_t
MSKTKAEFGSWISEINSKTLVQDKLVLRGQQIVQLSDGNFLWTVGKPSEKGRISIVKKVDNKVIDLILAPFNARTRVHEYGGSCVCSTSNGKFVYFINFSNQSLYCVSDDFKEPKVVFNKEGYRLADLQLDEKRNLILCVVEHHDGQSKYPKNFIGSISLIDGSLHILTSGNDFYSTPRFSNNHDKITWIEWKFPNMPWDETDLYFGKLNDTGTKLDEKVLISSDLDVSVSQPKFSLDDKRLFFISDKSGFANIGWYNFENQKCEFLNHGFKNVDFSQPGWKFGTNTYVFLGNYILASFIDKGVSKLALFEVDSSKSIELNVPISCFAEIQLTSAKGNDFKVAIIGGSFDQSWTVYSLDISINNGTPMSKLEIIHEEFNNKLNKENLSEPESVEFPTTFNGKETTSFGFFYPPKNANYEGIEGSKPPLLCKIHGGPTAAANSVLNLSIQYWTSHGFAVMDLNYGGSTGFGKEYQNRLRGNWGIVDVEDCVSAVKYCIKEKGVDSEKVCIDGGSAGGFSTLACLAFTNVFKAGCSLYGVSDLEALASDTHKFEARYLDLLVDSYDPKSENKKYKERSPIHHCEKIEAPMILLQGLEDKIVPPNQAEMFYKAVKEKGLPVSLILFEGEQHGFRISENIRKAYDSELYFYSKVFNFKLNEKDIEPIKIDNL